MNHNSNSQNQSQMMVAGCGGGFEIGNAEMAVVLDEEATIPK